jgi:type IV secretion system protein VirB11
MMLSLFKEAETPLTAIPAMACFRRLFIQSLNKGIIPSWEDLFLELPTMDSVEGLQDIKDAFTTLTEWDFLREILSQDATEFFFHSPTDSQLLRLSGEKEALKVSLNEEDWQLWLEIISLRFHQNWNVQVPFTSFYAELFGKKFRLSLIHGSTSPLGKSKLIIRSLSTTSHPLQSFGDSDKLSGLVAGKKNMLIAGSTGSGKTSLLTTLVDLIGPEEHLVILEDTYEILSRHPHQTRMLSGDTPATSLKAYLSYSLRLSPDRIILGEMRSHEVVPFVMAMNTGHKGLMGTLHASSAPDALNRVALLFSLYGGEANLDYNKVMELICRNLEIVVFMENKKVKDIIRILGSENGVPFFESLIHEVQELF